MKLCSPKPVITTSGVRFSGVKLSETISLPVDDTGRGFTRYTKSDAVERGFQRCVTVATSDRAIKRFEMNDPGPFKERPGCRALIAAGGLFCLEPEPPEYFMRGGSHSRSWDIFPGPRVRATKNFAGLASIPGTQIRSRSPSNMPEVESKSSGHLIHTRSPS